MPYKIKDLNPLGRQFNSTDIIEVSAAGTGSYKANIGNFTLGGTNYIFVNANGTPAENGYAVISAYSTAQSLTPNGNALSATNRVTILLSPGYYSFNEDSLGQFFVEYSFIDFQSLSGECDVYFSSINVYSVGYGIDVRVSGINTTKNNWYTHGAFAVSSVGGNDENIVINNCVGGNYSFGSYSDAFKGTIENCTAGNYSFGYVDNSVPSGIYPTSAGGFLLYGTFKNCTAGNYSFLSSMAGLSNLPVGNYGTIENCTAEDYSFIFCYYWSAFNNGTIKNCVSTGGTSFCVTGPNPSTGAAENNGLIDSCSAADSISFVTSQSSSSSSTNAGTIINCTAQSHSFVSNIAASTNLNNYGNIINCNAISGDYCFLGDVGFNNGYISDCIANNHSFSMTQPLGFITDIYRCTLIGGTFTTGTTAGGRVILCIDSTGIVNF